MYLSFLVCDGCRADVDHDHASRKDLDYYHNLAQAAKAQGWYVAPQYRDLEIDFTIYCKSCAKGRGLKQPDRGYRCTPPESIITVATLTAQRQKD